MKLIEDLGMHYPQRTSKKKARFGIYECPDCMVHFRTQTNLVNRGQSSRCRPCSYKVKNGKHNKTGTKLYLVWVAIRQRCNNKNNKQYINYGNRGIDVCQSWNEDYKSFEDWSLSNGYKEGLSIDRIDNDKGYHPYNCRWTTREVQSSNTRKLRKSNNTGFRGVSSPRSNRFVARIGVFGKYINLGTYDYPWTAAYAYDSYVLNNNLEHTRNFK